MTSATAVAERGHLLAPELEIAGEPEPIGARGSLRGPADDVTRTVTPELVRE